MKYSRIFSAMSSWFDYVSQSKVYPKNLKPVSGCEEYARFFLSIIFLNFGIAFVHGLQMICSYRLMALSSTQIGDILMQSGGLQCGTKLFLNFMI